MGRIEGQAKIDQFCQASIYVLPSFSENFGIAAVEAMAMGLPCVLGEGVAVGKEAAAGGACVLTTTNSEVIAERLSELITSSGRRQELGRAARAFVEESYSLEAMGKRLHGLYQEIVERVES